jgi:hypothetical protein
MMAISDVDQARPALPWVADSLAALAAAGQSPQNARLAKSRRLRDTS